MSIKSFFQSPFVRKIKKFHYSNHKTSSPGVSSEDTKQRSYIFDHFHVLCSDGKNMSVLF